MTVQPTVDLVQVFCLNFRSRLDFWGPTTRSVDVVWPELRGLDKSVILNAKLSRYTLEVFHVALSGEGKHLIPSPLDFYAERTIGELADAHAIASVLLHPEIALANGSLEEVEVAVRRDLRRWHKLAVAILAEEA